MPLNPSSSRRTALVAAIILLAAACRLFAAAPFPLERIYDQAQFSMLKLSPDGRLLTAVVQTDPGMFREVALLDDKVTQMLVQVDLETQQITPLMGLNNAYLEDYWWKGNDQILFLVHTKNAGSEFRSLNFGTRKVNFLYHLTGESVYLVNTLPGEPDNVLISLEVGGARNLKRLNIGTGKTIAVEASRGFVHQWIINDKGDAVAATGFDPEQNTLPLLWRPDLKSEWISRNLGKGSEPSSLSIAGIDADQRHLLAWDFSGSGTATVVRLDPATMEKTIVFQSPEVDPDEVLSLGENNTQPYAIGYETDRPHLFFLDDEARKLQAAIDAALPDTVNRVVSTSLNRKVMVILSQNDCERGSYHLLDRDRHHVVTLGSQYAGLDRANFLPSRFVHFKARDGLAFTGRLTLPAPGDGPPPLIVLSGTYFAGPRSRYEFGVGEQLFATRGYAVLRVDYRGTSGFGEGFLRAGNYQIGSGMPHDLEDAVKALAEEHAIDASRVALFGSDRGSLVMLHALADSDQFCAWVNFDMPLSVRGLDYSDFAMVRRQERLAIADLGGRRAASQFQGSLDPRPLVEKLTMPSFHFYGWHEGRSKVTSFLKSAKAAAVIEPPNPSKEPESYHGYLVTVYQHVLDFLDQNLMHARSATTPPGSRR